MYQHKVQEENKCILLYNLSRWNNSIEWRLFAQWYMIQKSNSSSIFQLMAWCLFSTKAFPEPVLNRISITFRVSGKSYVHIIFRHCAPCLIEFILSYDYHICHIEFYSTEAHKGHHCKYLFRKVFLISARFFLFPQGFFLFPQGFFNFRKFFFISARFTYLRKVLLISARFVSFPQGYTISARFVSFPQGYPQGVSGKSYVHIIFRHCAPCLIEFILSYDYHICHIEFYSTEAHKGHHCKYLFRKVFLISARFFLFPQGFFLFPQGFFNFRKFFFISARFTYLRKVLLISARFVSFPQGYTISARFVSFPQGYSNFRKVCFISARLFNFRENIFNGNHQGTGRPRSFDVMARFEQYCRDIGIGDSQFEKMNDEKVCIA